MNVSKSFNKKNFPCSEIHHFFKSHLLGLPGLQKSSMALVSHQYPWLIDHTKKPLHRPPASRDWEGGGSTHRNSTGTSALKKHLTKRKKGVEAIFKPAEKNEFYWSEMISQRSQVHIRYSDLALQTCSAFLDLTQVYMNSYHILHIKHRNLDGEKKLSGILRLVKYQKMKNGVIV